jgi:hypothetical protein
VGRQNAVGHLSSYLRAVAVLSNLSNAVRCDSIVAQPIL